jgi:high-affinity iron transporter
MLPSFVVTLREGLEAFLIDAISLAYLKKTGRAELAKGVYWGIAASIVVSIAAGIALARVANQALWEGVLALVAAVLVATLTVHMWRVARHIKSDIEQSLETSAQRTGAMALVGVFLFTLLMITREGMETALLMNALLLQVKSPMLIAGAVLGIVVAALVALAWSRWGHHVNLGLFLQVTAVFLLVFLVQLLIYGFHELSEANVLPASEALHWATEPYGPDGRYGRYLSYLLVLVPAGWLAFSMLFGRKRAAVPAGAPPAEG